MAKVDNPLFSNFFEAFSDTIVFQRNAHGTPFARVKVKHPTNQRSAHYPLNARKWATAVQQHQDDEAPDEQLIDYVAHYALAPDRPTNIQCTALSDDPGDPQKQIFTITWGAPTTKYNGHPLDNLLGYFIEWTQDFVTWTRFNDEPHTSTEFTASVPTGDIWLIVLATDDQDNVSSPSQEFFLELTSQTAYFDLCFFNVARFLGPGANDEQAQFNSCHFDVVELM